MSDYETFKSKVYRKTGIDLSSYKEKQMKRRIKSLSNRNGFDDLNEYFTFIDKDKNKLDEFINFLTINVSEFFRNPEQWAIVQEKILPRMFNTNNHVKIWSAACSTGEEPYTISMILSEMNISKSNYTIIASDIDQGAIDKAKLGLYNKNALKNVNNSMIKKYFHTTIDEKYQINEDLKQKIKFYKHDLLKDKYFNDCNLIVCRNVMIYFTDEAKNDIYKNFVDSLVKDGVLFVGSTEQIISPQQFGLRSLKTFFYGKTESDIKF